MKDIKSVIQRLISDLNEMLVVVEGKRDVQALDRIGVRWKVVTFEEFMRDKSLYEPRGVILTDFDRAGEIKAKLVRAEMIDRGMKVDDGLRIRFGRVFGTLTVEEVPQVFKKFMERGDYG